jgi:hypothetical protein
MPSDRSNLENLARARQLHAEPPDEAETDKLLSGARRSLKDARAPGLAASSRFSLAYNAAHALALAALRSAGYRPSGSGHRIVLFQVLEFTVSAPKRLALALAQHHTRRNRVEYEAAEVSEIEANDLIELATELQILAERRMKPR